MKHTNIKGNRKSKRKERATRQECNNAKDKMKAKAAPQDNARRRGELKKCPHSMKTLLIYQEVKW